MIVLKQAVCYLGFENLGVLFWGRRPEAKVEVDHPCSVAVISLIDWPSWLVMTAVQVYKKLRRTRALISKGTT